MAAAVACAATALLLVAIGALSRPLPADWLAPGESRRVLDRHGGVLAERTVPDRGREAWVELDAVAPAFVSALLAAEDRRYFAHPGLDPSGVLRAAMANVRAGRVVQGGSTITQQTARLLAGRPPGLRGKVVEAWRALRLEVHLSKREILAWYVNRAYFGRGAWGVEAAARAWFDESAAGLSIAEAAALVALLPAPDRLSPDQAPSDAAARRGRVIDAMVATGALDPDSAARAKAEPLELRRPERRPVAPHLSARLLRGEGAVIRSTVDPRLQAFVERAVREELDALAGREVDHAAVLVAEIASGDVLAYVGSGDFGAADGQVDGVQSRRSPGSTLKPFLYGLAFERGWRPSDVLPDVPRRWSTSHGSWAPENYGGSFRGPMRVREALACSANVPAVALLEAVGVATLLDRLMVAGVRFEERPAHYGLGLVLGGSEASLEEIVTAYAGLARGGHAPLRFREDDPRPEPVRFLDERASWIVVDILSDPVARVPAFGRRGPLSRAYPVAVKTGTSTGFRDNWTVGFTPEHIVGVWVGNFDSRPMGDVSGVTGAGPLWARVMDEVNGGARRAFPPAPDGLEQRPFCALSGQAPGPRCPHVVHDWVPLEDEPVAPCAWHVEDCGVAWPPEYRSWAADEGRLEAGEGCPTAGRIAIAWPVDGATLYLEPGLPPEEQVVFLRASAPVGAREARWTVDGAPVDATGRGPLEAAWRPRAGDHVVGLEVDGIRADPVRVRITGAQYPGEMEEP